MIELRNYISCYKILILGLYQTQSLEHSYPAPPMPEKLVGEQEVPSEST